MLSIISDLARVVTGRLSSAATRKAIVIAAGCGVAVGAAAVTATRLALKEQDKEAADEAAKKAADQDTTTAPASK